MSGNSIRFSNGLSDLVIERDPDGLLRISVHDRERPGFTYAVKDIGDQAEIASFIRGEV